MSLQYKYSVDAGALIVAHRLQYPMDVFPSWWNWIEQVIAQGKLFLCDETFREITPGDSLHQWANTQRRNNPVFVRRTGADETRAWNELLVRVPELSHPKSAGNIDRLVIAHACVTNTTVITQEAASGGPDVVKIPDVCDQLDIECLNLLTFMRREGASF